MKKLLKALRSLFISRKQCSLQLAEYSETLMLQEYHAIQNSIYESGTFQQLTNCRRWADRFNDKYQGAGVYRSMLYRQCGEQQELITAAAGLLDCIPGITHSLSKTF